MSRLEDQLKKQSEDLTVLREFQTEVREKEAKREEKRLKKRLMVPQPKRDRISVLEFYKLLEMVNGNSYKHQRCFVMFVMLYITGLRAGNLALIKVKHVKDLFQSGETTIKVIKKGPDRHQIKLSPDQRALLHTCGEKLNFLFVKKKLYDFAFTPKGRPDGVCSPWVYKIVLNHFLLDLSKKTGKKVSTHSFRISMISDLLETLDLHTVRKIIGHKSINSTLIYDRTRVCFETVFSSLDTTRKQVDM